MINPEDLKQAGSFNLQMLLSIPSQIAGAAADAFLTIPRKISDYYGEIGGGVLSFTRDAAQTTAQNINTLVPPLQSAIAFPLTGLGQGLGSGLSNIGTGLGTGLQQTGQGLGSGLQNTGQGLGGGLNSLILPAVVAVVLFGGIMFLSKMR
ncbi:hypothetical protein COU37_01770 [Candidatus Micrarchaeota archaeon CG10_big_fil_rev_8_21_14_0_10_45_29]|nr:MAG: hypothetical protein COU37_01770 [Candidatus Micrarchaeota archaeon CG10_big_fil_rev_8_21_14_0_10_45_29]